jgi:hypothetical protein
MSVTNLSDIRALSSFRNLIDLCSKAPWRARALMDAASQTAENYPKQVAVYYLLGLIRGSLNTDDPSKIEKFMKIISKGHEGMLNDRPADYFGDKRKHGKTGDYTKDDK